MKIGSKSKLLLKLMLIGKINKNLKSKKKLKFAENPKEDAYDSVYRITITETVEPLETTPTNSQVENVDKTGHSLINHILLCFVYVGFFTIPYYSISKKHYWHKKKK